MPLEKGYPELDPRKQGSRQEIDPRIPPVAGSQVDPRIGGTEGPRIDVDNSGEKANRLRKKFYPGL